jgi:hypothetical protein
VRPGKAPVQDNVNGYRENERNESRQRNELRAGQCWPGEGFTLGRNREMMHSRSQRAL